jgi:hypothetical protein
MKYVISGLAPGFGGVPKLLEYINNNSDKNKITLLCPKAVSLKKENKKKFYRLLLDRIERSLNSFLRILFLMSVQRLKNKEIVIIHFQSLGLKKTQKLLANNNSYLYLIDNTFFCLKSYNELDSNECIKCISKTVNEASNNKCSPFHFQYSINDYINFYEFLKLEYKNIKFLCLSDSQSKLLELQYGDKVKYESLYFLISDFENQLLDIKFSKVSDDYDFVFHGSNHSAKGSDYILKLANNLPDLKFLFPFNLTKKYLPRENITFKHMTWESGLREAVINAKCVLTPSTWSNTPEAATIKSFQFNGNVVMYNTNYGFSQELKDVTLQLTGVESKDLEILREAIDMSYDKSQIKKLKKDFEEYYFSKTAVFKDFFHCKK